MLLKYLVLLHVPVSVLCRFLAVPWVLLWPMIVAFPCHTKAGDVSSSWNISFSSATNYLFFVQDLFYLKGIYVSKALTCMNFCSV